MFPNSISEGGTASETRDEVAGLLVDPAWSPGRAL